MRAFNAQNPSHPSDIRSQAPGWDAAEALDPNSAVSTSIGPFQETLAWHLPGLNKTMRVQRHSRSQTHAVGGGLAACHDISHNQRQMHVHKCDPLQIPVMRRLLNVKSRSGTVYKLPVIIII